MLKQHINKVNLTILLLIFLAIVFFAHILTTMNAKKLEPSVKSSIDTPTNLTTNTSDNFIDILTCFDDATESTQKCLDTFMRTYYENKSTKQVLAQIEAYRPINSSIENQCHPITHSIGRITYEKYGNVGDAFEQCDQTCHSGCYHGVMERLFFEDEEITDTTAHLVYDDFKSKIPGICDADKFKTPTNAVIFQCLHGVGHAVLYSIDYDLVEALKVCDLFATTYDRESCYGGVLMENVTAFDKDKREIKDTDPHYPCNILGARYQNACYMMQTSIMTEIGLTNQQIGEECKNASDIRACYISLGRDNSNSVRLNALASAVQVCEEYSVGNERSCIDGLVYALIDNTWDAKFAYQYCEALASSTFRELCFMDSNNYLESTYLFAKKDLQAQCDKYSVNHLQQCKEIAVGQ